MRCLRWTFPDASMLTRHLPRIVMGCFAAALLGLCLKSDPEKLSEGRFFSDGATYYSMTWSLVGDFDLEYTAGDLARVKREYPGGPSGIFLKRAFGGLELDDSAPFIKRVGSPRIYFGKAMTYPVMAAPFVAIFGTRGFLVFNGLCLMVAWGCAFADIGMRTSPWKRANIAPSLANASVRNLSATGWPSFRSSAR